MRWYEERKGLGWPFYLLLWAGIPLKKWSLTCRSHAVSKAKRSLSPRQTIQYHSDPRYTPTTHAKETEVERFYDNLLVLLELTPKKDVFFHHKRLKCKSRKSRDTWITGKFGLGLQNEAGQRLTGSCQENTPVIANTLFQQHKRWLYTWTSPDGQ